jgi:hypothetical protein
MASGSDAIAPLSFDKLMALLPVESSSERGSQASENFRSIAPAWAPGGRGTAFGGHVYAQAAWAASRTVGRGMVIHVRSVLPCSRSRGHHGFSAKRELCAGIRGLFQRTDCIMLTARIRAEYDRFLYTTRQN